MTIATILLLNIDYLTIYKNIILLILYSFSKNEIMVSKKEKKKKLSVKYSDSVLIVKFFSRKEELGK